MSPIDFIELTAPWFDESESKNVAAAIASGKVAGDGPFTLLCQEVLQRALGINDVLLTTSCTHALEMAALLLDIRPGDEVIAPTFTFVSTVNAFVLRGAVPIFADIRADTLNLDEVMLERLVTPRTRAIIPVHYGGVGCEMDTIQAVAAHHHIPVVEDNAHGLFAKYKGKYLGTFGRMATQSFHQTKNFSCGEGGALLLNDPEYSERAAVIREKGTNRNRFMRGEVNRYTWVDVGSSYLSSDILAAVLLAQLEKRDWIQARRQRIWRYYDMSLRCLTERGVRLTSPPVYCEHSSHIFPILLPSKADRNRLMLYLEAAGIRSAFHYSPLHLSGMGQSFGGRSGQCPVAEVAAEQLLRLPLHPGLADEDLGRIVQAVADGLARL